MKRKGFNWPFLIGAALIVALVVGGSMAIGDSGLWLFLP